MQLTGSIRTVDSHTMGEPTRVVVSGIHVKGKTMVEVKQWLEQERDEMRRSLMLEPRGHDDMFGSILVKPDHPEADFGIVFMDGGGYLNMCGHGIIGATTVVLETGMMTATEPITQVTFETPAGLVKTRAKVKGTSVESVSFENVPAFVEREGVKVQLPGVGEVTLDIVFGGSFFAIVSADELKVSVSRENTQQLIEKGLLLRNTVNNQMKLQHPTHPHINSIDLVEIFDKTKRQGATLKNAVIFGNGQVDRSPCGTGTCAKMALLYRQGKLKLHEAFVYESILGTMFSGQLLQETMVGNKEGVVPEITGSAYITGFNHFVIDPEDPLKYGFTLRG